MTACFRIFDVEHGACAMLCTDTSPRIAMIDCGRNQTTGWRPGNFLRTRLNRSHVDYLLVTNVDQDHISDLSTMLGSGITIGALISNTLVSVPTLRQIKQRCGALTADAETYLSMRLGGGPPGSGAPFDQVMGGITARAYFHSPAQFDNTNDLSGVYFVSYGSFKMLFPGDIERPGWLAHLCNPAFVNELRTTTVLVASHHGRTSGYCDEVFNFLRPQAVVISDKSIMYGTQETVPDYRQVIIGDGVRITNEISRRHVLTTRRDGDIVFRVSNDTQGNYQITLGVS